MHSALDKKYLKFSGRVKYSKRHTKNRTELSPASPRLPSLYPPYRPRRLGGRALSGDSDYSTDSNDSHFGARPSAVKRGTRGSSKGPRPSPGTMNETGPMRAPLNRRVPKRVVRKVPKKKVANLDFNDPLELGKRSTPGHNNTRLISNLNAGPLSRHRNMSIPRRGKNYSLDRRGKYPSGSRHATKYDPDELLNYLSYGNGYYPTSASKRRNGPMSISELYQNKYELPTISSLGKVKKLSDIDFKIQDNVLTEDAKTFLKNISEVLKEGDSDYFANHQSNKKKKRYRN